MLPGSTPVRAKGGASVASSSERMLVELVRKWAWATHTPIRTLSGESVALLTRSGWLPQAYKISTVHRTLSWQLNVR